MLNVFFTRIACADGILSMLYFLGAMFFFDVAETESKTDFG